MDSIFLRLEVRRRRLAATIASKSSDVSGTSGCVGGAGSGGRDGVGGTVESVIATAGDDGLTFSDTMAIATVDGWLTAEDGARILAIDLRRILRLAAI